MNIYRARNEAIKVSTGDYVTFLDTDDLWESNKLEKQIEFFKLNKKAKLLYTNYNIFRQPKNKINLFLKNGYFFRYLHTGRKKHGRPIDCMESKYILTY